MRQRPHHGESTENGPVLYMALELSASRWQLAVGTALARATTVELHEGVLTVQSPDPRWALEINRSRDIVLGRVQHYLGAEHVKSLRIEKPAGKSRRPSS